jgi:xylulokinase
MPQTLAFDLGGSSLRLAIVAADGRFAASVRKPLAIQSPDGVVFDIDPLDWWRAFVDGCSELAAGGHDLAAVSAIAGCGFTRTQVFLDALGRPVRPAIPFQDSRSAKLLKEIAASGSDLVRRSIRGLGPYDPLSRLLWIKRSEPGHWAQVRKVVEPKDFINLMLTGIAASDRISQTPLTRALEAGGDDVLGALGIDPGILPDTLSPFAPVGRARSGLPGPLSRLAGVPVHCGSIDTWSCVLGSGALRPGVAYSISGTSDVSGVISEAAHAAPGLLTVEWGAGLWQLGGPSQGAATRLQWALDRFCPDRPATQTLEEAITRTGEVPLFLPYLDGERTPWWDPDLRGAFLGLGTSHRGGDFVRAVAEGMNYLSREILSRAEEASGTRVSHVCFSGGLAGNPVLCQLKADVLDRPVFVPDNSETGLMGAACLPWGEADLARARPIDGIFYQPGHDRRQYHDERFVIFRKASLANAEISTLLATQGRR